MFMSAVVVIVMIASHVRIKHEIASQQSLDRIVTESADSAKQFNSLLGKRRLCASPDTATDEGRDSKRRKQVCQRTVPLTVGVDHS
jgi:hypothetical protein